jgi:glycosyltransferase involved in cell wall biosynthesis
VNESAARPPRISVVMPSFNAAATIERALRSIESQRYPDLQVLCVDGGSTDGTVAVIERHAPLVSWWTSEPDRGAAHALNKGFRKADGDVFCWLNADDELAPGALHAVARELARHPEADVVTGGCVRFYADGSRCETAVPDWFVDQVALRDGLEQPSTFWTAAIHRKAGELDENYRFAFDWEWWNRLEACGARFVRVPEVLSHYHFSEENLTSRGAQGVVDEMYRVTKRYAPHRGRIADVYMLLYRWFDLRGYYDPPRWKLPWWRRVPFSLARRALGLVYGRKAIEAYNWNWASKQVRGLVWYK